MITEGSCNIGSNAAMYVRVCVYVFCTTCNLLCLGKDGCEPSETFIDNESNLHLVHPPPYWLIIISQASVCMPRHVYDAYETTSKYRHCHPFPLVSILFFFISSSSSHVWLHLYFMFIPTKTCVYCYRESQGCLIVWRDYQVVHLHHIFVFSRERRSWNISVYLSRRFISIREPDESPTSLL